MRFQPLARIEPDDVPPTAGAVSRLERYPTKIPSPDDRRRLGRDALVVVAERAEAAGARGVGGDIDMGRSVAERPELVDRQERVARVRQLHPEDAVQLDRVPARLVDLEGELAAVEEDGPPALGAGRGHEERLGLVGDARASSARCIAWTNS